MMNKEVEDLYTYLQAIRKRPSMFVHDYSLKEVHLLCQGYATALFAHGIKEFGTDFDKSFSDYLRKKCDWDLSYGWPHAIDITTKGPKDSFDTFFTLLDDFKRNGEGKL